MAEYIKVNVNLSDSQLNILKPAAGNQTWAPLSMNIIFLMEVNLPHELLSAKLKNAIENNMSTDIKMPKTQISKIIHSG